jgi:hypothetical protein
MKTMKTILLTASLIAASVVSTLSAQQDAQYQFSVAKGDTVMFSENIERYCTGEEPSKWVYGKTFIVRQLGTKRFPDGVLLMPILSWIHEADLVNVNGRAQQAVDDYNNQADAESQAAQKAKQDSIAAAKADQQAQRDSIAAAQALKARQDSIAAAQAQAQLDSIAAAQAAQAEQDSIAAAQMAKGDSISSKQNFKHNYDRFTIGLRGGASALLHEVNQGKWLCGGDVLLDLQYAHYWTKDGRPVDLGLLVGLSLGYSQSGMKANVDTYDQVLDNTDPSFPMHVDYTVRADEVKENDGQLQMEVPLMFSLITERGFFFNIGPKFMLPLYTPYKQTISDNDNTYITAYFEEIGVPVTNEVITGVLKESDYTTRASDNGNQFSINVMLGTELGYEWVLNSGNSLGLGVYANYCVYNSFKNEAANTPLIEVTPPQANSVAQVDVHSATKTYANKLGYFDAGLKIAYHFNFPKKHKYIDSKLFE